MVHIRPDLQREFDSHSLFEGDYPGRAYYLMNMLHGCAPVILENGGRESKRILSLEKGGYRFRDKKIAVTRDDIPEIPDHLVKRLYWQLVRDYNNSL